MNVDTFRHLNRGDIVRSKKFPDISFIVDSNYRLRVTAVATVDMTNHEEWDLIHKASYTRVFKEIPNGED